jgi:hypothetical protein
MAKKNRPAGPNGSLAVVERTNGSDPEPVTASPMAEETAIHSDGRNDETAAAESRGSEDTSDVTSRIAARAYERYLARGCEHGFDQEDWFQAEQECRESHAGHA